MEEATIIKQYRIVVIHDRGRLNGVICPVCASPDVFYEGDVLSYPGLTPEEIATVAAVRGDDYVCFECGSVFIITRIGDSMRHKLQLQ